MESHSLYFVFYALFATIGGIIIAQAQYNRKKNEGKPINFKLLKVVFGFALMMWTGAALAGVYYTASHIAITVSGILIGVILSLFFGWQINKVIRKIEADEKTIEELATHDALTGLWIRRVFHQTLKKEIKTADELKQPLCLMFLEIDNLMDINEEHGYEAGDFVLRKVARIVTKAVRPTDVVCRYRSMEIAVIFPNMSLTTAEKFCRSFQAEIAGHTFDAGDGLQLRTTVTIGLVAYSEHTPTEASFVDGGESALFFAREYGRNSFLMA